MKLLVLSCVIISALAEPPRFRTARYRFQRQQLAPTTTDSPTEATTEQSGPYPPSGWKPAGQPFTLPTEDKKPAEQYGPPAPYPPSGWKPQGQAFELPKPTPATTYGAPESVYGVPDNTYGTPNNTEAPTTENPDTDRLVNLLDVVKNIGSYFVVLPENQLKKIFITEKDVDKMKKGARLQLLNTSPVLIFNV